MKHRLTIFLLLFISFFFLLPLSSIAEGTLQLMPDSNVNRTYILLVKYSDGFGGQRRDSFAIEGATYRYRLYIHVSSDYANEEIHFGLGNQVGTAGNVPWKIYAPDNSVIWSGTTPTSGAGFISSYKEAYAGPKILDPTDGYTSNVVVPTMPGDYYMTFTLNTYQKRV